MRAFSSASFLLVSVGKIGSFTLALRIEALISLEISSSSSSSLKSQWAVELAKAAEEQDKEDLKAAEFVEFKKSCLTQVGLLLEADFLNLASVFLLFLSLL